MNPESSLANIINEHIVTPVKVKFDNLAVANTKQDEAICALKEICEQNKKAIAELNQLLLQANETIEKQSEELKKQLDLLQKQSSELAEANNKIEHSRQRQTELEEAIVNISWEE